MKRAGFTMIELIFVIVILGILSAVALPKFIGVSEQAKAGKCKALVGTLNRTVGPALWSESLMDDRNGSVTNSTTGLATDITTQITIPPECGVAADYAADSNVTVGSKTYSVDFTDGNTSSAPTWTWTQN